MNLEVILEINDDEETLKRVDNHNNQKQDGLKENDKVEDKRTNVVKVPNSKKGNNKLPTNLRSDETRLVHGFWSCLYED